MRKLKGPLIFIIWFFPVSPLMMNEACMVRDDWQYVFHRDYSPLTSERGLPQQLRQHILRAALGHGWLSLSVTNTKTPYDTVA
jgi:hypothetical protein